MSVDRRRFLSGTVLGGAAAVVTATAFGAADPAAAFERDMPALAPGAVDPNFIDGRVMSVSKNALGVRGSDQVLHRIIVTGGTSLWKMEAVGMDQVLVGDGLYARGARLPDGTLAADAIWVNIVNLDAHITSISASRMELNHNGKKIVAHVVKGKSAATYRGQAATGDLSGLRVGHAVKVIGVWIPDTNEVNVSTVHSMAPAA
ncbi:cell wall protein [Fodinicola feengrottensis]|uniref:Cell wall protein n=1 Tax=Fodinicola feengrottensis TaxID=435914 RepID=A0ABN2FQC2_9ACTN|nr:cell wall protein [Fodinicola feengrottensis]